MAKPLKRILDWASGGTQTDPGGAKEALGFILNERVPFTWLNWIFASFGEWISYLDSREVADDGETLTLIATLPRDTGDVLNVYGSDDAFFFAKNAEWGGSFFVPAGNGDASVFTLSTETLRPDFIIEYGTLAGGAFQRQLRGLPIRAWGRIRSGNAPSVIMNGSNMPNAPTADGTGLSLVVDVSFLNATSAMVLATASDPDVNIGATISGTNTVLLAATDISTGLNWDLTNEANNPARDIHIAVLGFD